MPPPSPASTNASTIRACVRGQCSEALSTTVLPQASGMAIARTPRMIGAFHGAMPSTTPAGSRSAMAMQPGLSDGMTSPPICVVSAAASRTMPTASMRLNRAQPSVAPISPIIASTNRRPSPRARRPPWSARRGGRWGRAHSKPASAAAAASQAALRIVDTSGRSAGDQFPGVGIVPFESAPVGSSARRTTNTELECRGRHRPLRFDFIVI